MSSMSDSRGGSQGGAGTIGGVELGVLGPLDAQRRGRSVAIAGAKPRALLGAGRAAEVVGELEAAVADEPLRERRWAQLMLALYRAGRQGEALRAYQRARTTLADELGVEPGGELRRLEAAVVAQDPALD